MIASGYGGPSQSRRTNSSAVTSLVFGILGMIGVGPLGILAIVLGRRALRQIGVTGDEGYGIAKAGVILGWIAVALMVLTLLLLLVGSCAGPCRSVGRRSGRVARRLRHPGRRIDGHRHSGRARRLASFRAQWHRLITVAAG